VIIVDGHDNGSGSVVVDGDGSSDGDIVVVAVSDW
jgi:hypothetical protein